MKKRSAPKGEPSRKAGIPVPHRFPPDYDSFANRIEYLRPTEMQTGIAATLDMRCAEKASRAGLPHTSESVDAWGKAYRYRIPREYGGASTFERGEVFKDGKE
jgi:hypothetical protein